MVNNKPEEVKEMTKDMTRFAMHILLVHFLTYWIDPSYITTHKQALRTVIVTIVAILIYYVLLKDYIIENLENIYEKIQQDE